MKKIAVSACLLGDRCRYDGQIKSDEKLLAALQGYEVIAFCPEAPLFGTPRERISILHVNGNYCVRTDNTNRDVTELLKEKTLEFISHNPDIEIFLLKSKSPSCALGTAQILDEERRFLTYGDGISASVFKSVSPNCIFKDEHSFMQACVDVRNY